MNLLIFAAIGIFLSAIWLFLTITTTKEWYDINGQLMKPAPPQKNKFKTPPGIGHTILPKRPYRNTATWMAYIRMKHREIANKNRN